MGNCHKKAQTSGTEVSILIILIALFIGAYVILLPPEERQALLPESTESASTTTEEAQSQNLLLSESPGMIASYKKNIQETTLEPAHIYIKDETTTSSLIKSLTVSKTLVQDNYKDVLFKIDSPADLKSAKIVFMISESKGELKLRLNGNTIYEGELRASDLPLTLPKEYLQKDNVLEMSSNSPGWKIFSSNYYMLKDINLIKETSTKKVKASRSFSIDAEDNTISKASMTYFVNCNTASEGELTISLNSKQIFQDRIFCQYMEKREQTLPKEYLNDKGTNTISFEIDKGDYNIDELKLKLTLGRSTHPQYAFEVSSDSYNKIQNGKKATLYMKFAVDDTKSAKITLNDKQFMLDSAGTEYKRDISSLIKLGPNTLAIEPQKAFDIMKLQVKLE